ncbi:PRD domain-containing protein [Alteribacillus sp. HJP-4]|uniref:PRD domain-containing protein n=1 Tax=Alteribacillus sp. HJP-4 TaxID=2775394 RepID=UPI0035CCF47E
MEHLMKQAMLHLLCNERATLTDLEEQLEVSSSQLEKVIQSIDKELQEHKFPALSADEKQEISLTADMREGLFTILREATYFSVDYLTPELRVHVMLLKLLMESRPLSLQDLAETTEVSKNTVLHDMKLLKLVLKEKALQINYSRKDGYFLKGSEYKLRNLLVTEAKQLFHYEIAYYLLKQKQLLHPNEVFLLRQRLLRIEKRLEVSFTDEQIEELPVILHLLIQRIQAFQREWIPETSRYEGMETKEYELLKEMFWDQQELTEKDRLYLALQVLSSNMLEAAIDLSQSHELETAIDLFLDQIELQLVTNLIRRNELREKLIVHIRPAVYRTRLGLLVRNPLTKVFTEENSSICSIVDGAVGSLESFIGKEIAEEERVYIAMLVQAWIYQTNEQGETIFRAMVVCRNGTSVSKLLLETLRLMFPHIDFIGAYSERTFSAQPKVDFIFTTVPLRTNQKTFIVPPVLGQKERMVLRRKVMHSIEHDNEKRAKELVHSLKEYISSDQQEMVRDKIVTFFEQGPNKRPQEASLAQKESYFSFNEENVRLVQTKIDWQKALAESLERMKMRSSIDEGYILEVQSSFEKECSRMVLGPHVYLPHAKPEAGVLQEDFEVLIFREPVRMPDGGTAKALVTLAPIDFQHHVPTLLRLNEIFLDEERAKRIFRAAEVVDIIAELQKEENGLYAM